MESETHSEASPRIRRSIECFRWRGESIVATRHHARAADGSRDSAVLLLLNAGPAPRAGNSDLSVRIADACARLGIPTVRIDAVGVGDSTGRSHARIDDFRSAAQESDLDELVVSVARTLVERGDASRVMLGGLCAGAVLAVRAGARLGDSCGALVLLEPDFVQARLAGPPGQRMGAPGAKARGPLRSFVGRCARAAARRLRSRGIGEPLARFLDWSGSLVAPTGLCRPLVAAWTRLLETGTPSLVVVGEGLESGRVVRTILRGAKGGASRVTMIEVPRTNHILTAGDAIAALPGRIARWTAEAAGRGLTLAPDTTREAMPDTADAPQVGTPSRRAASFGVSRVGVPDLGSSDLGSSNLGVSALGASALQVSDLEASALGVSRVGPSAVAVSNAGDPGVRTSSLRTSSLGTSSLGACGVEPSSREASIPTPARLEATRVGE